MITRILFSLTDYMETPVAAGESMFGTIKIAVMPIIKVFTMCLLGLLMASKYVNILPPSGRKLLNGLVFSLLLPCLIFSQLGQAVTLQKMLQWWFIPVNVVLATISGSLIGLVVASIIHPPYPYFNFTIIQIGVGNIGNVPLVLLAALCRDPSNPFGDFEKCSLDGTAYISFGQWVGAIILYTYVYHMFTPPPEGFEPEEEEEDNLPLKNLPQDAAPEEVPLLTQNYPNDVASPHFHLPIEGTEPIASVDNHNTRSSKIEEIYVFLFEKLKLKRIVQPAIVASILAMILGAIPFTKKLIFTNGSPLFFITDSCTILGDAMIPCILLALGGNLINGPGSSKLGFKTTASIIFARLVLVPPVGLGIVTLADKFGFLPSDDKMFRFVLLLQHTMPTSVLSGAVANLRGCGRESAAVLFWVHIFAIFSMAGWMVLYINILF